MRQQKTLPVIGLLGVLVSLISTEVRGQSVGFCTTLHGKQGQCKPLVKCVRFVHEIPLLQNQPCQLLTGEVGVCCPHIVIGTATFRKPRRNTVLRRPPRPPVPLPPIRTNDIQQANFGAEQRLQVRRQIEAGLRQAGLVISRGSLTPVAKHKRLQKTTAKARSLGRKAAKLVEASNQLQQSFNLSPAQGTHALPVFSLVGTSLAVSDEDHAEMCNAIDGSTGFVLEAGQCRSANLEFRSVDGSCNNRQHSIWGQANIALQRLLHPQYEDGISRPRGQMSNDPTVSSLPSPRDVSEALVADHDKPSQEFTLLLMQWGQFVDHDMTHTPLVEGEDDSAILCCSNGNVVRGDLAHPECMPISISSTDSFYGRLGQQCMEFVRSMPARNAECHLGPREQVNQITAFLDASNVYGSETSEARLLRLGRRGRLRVTQYGGSELLPLDPDECADHSKRQYCFAAGDARCNEQPQLTVMHTLWLREHNRIVSQLSLLNSQWDDERLYQEARKIVGAQLQHITFNEWLPLILGTRYMDDNNLSPSKSGFTQDYDPSIEPSITNAFATAAFRFGHSLVQGQIEWFGLFGNRLKALQLHRHQLEPFEIYEQNSIDSFLRGLTTQPSQELDGSFSAELTDHLFQERNTSHGMDLVALNLQRGRDHGIPGYMEYRKLCGLPRLTTWREIVNVVASPEIVPRLQRLYSSIEEIDLFLGGMLERGTSGSLVGPTFQCIIGDQFKRLKFGDRFWFEEGNQPNSFSLDQLNALRESSLARIICDNGDNMQQVQPLVFKKASGMNQKASCSGKGIPRVNLEAWRNAN
eukprot:maker-scaffold274_size229011-snap-gene-1.21 protein:Tk02572 transcript:maker-scaffold274_size229011-snap-gene-1.21-mRNA-1 annotation:"chorion peroxidase-like"